MEKFEEYTLSGYKDFIWYVFNNSLFIEKRFKCDLQNRIIEFKREEIEDIISFISTESVVQ